MRALLDLKIDQRYVTRFNSESDVVEGRAQTTELIEVLDDLHSRLNKGSVKAMKETKYSPENEPDVVTWHLMSPNGSFVSIVKIPHGRVVNASDKTDAKITNTVEPPSEMSSSVGVQDDSYSVVIHDPETDVRLNHHISGSQLTVQRTEILPQELHDMAHGHAESELRNLVNWSSLIKGRACLGAEEVVSLSNFIDSLTAN